MKRRLFNFMTALSLLLCVAGAILWVRSWGHHAVTLWAQPGYMVDVTRTDGVLGLTVARDSLLHVYVTGGTLYGLSHHRRPASPGGDRTTFTYNDWGFGLHLLKTVGPPPRGQWRVGGKPIWIVYVPGWMPVVLLGVLPTAWVGRRLRSRRRRRAGLCSRCGYDLRATPDRCPECGAAPGPAA
jgi:hypothetical protein